MKKKYIDADLLNADLDKWVEVMADAEGDYADGVRFAIQHFIFLVASLLHEQPKPSGYDKALLEVKSKVDEFYEDASIGLSEYDSGLYNGIAETCMKLRGFIKARLDSDEQPEVDLEKEVTHFVSDDKILSRLVKYDDALLIARHFYELGLNARKEENK